MSVLEPKITYACEEKKQRNQKPDAVITKDTEANQIELDAFPFVEEMVEQTFSSGGPHKGEFRSAAPY